MNLSEVAAALKTLHSKLSLVRGRKCEFLSLQLSEEKGELVGHIEAWLEEVKVNNKKEMVDRILRDMPMSALSKRFTQVELEEVLRGDKVPEFFFSDEMTTS